MKSLLTFSCHACGVELPRPNPEAPTWASFMASDAVRWSSELTPTEANAEGPWPWPDRTPRPGEEQLIRVEAPFAYPSQDATPWLLFQPDRSAWNGWGYAPDEMALSTFCRVSLISIVSRDASSAWLRVRLEEILPLAELTRLPLHPSSQTSLLTLLAGSQDPRSERSRSGSYAYYAYSADGDLGEWAVCHDDGAAWSLILQGVWDFHSNMIYAGRRCLTVTELAALGLDELKP